MVSTALGAEGIDVRQDEHFLLANESSESWIQRLTALAGSPGQRAVLIENGVRLARERYDWKALGERLVDTYRRWLDDGRTAVSTEAMAEADNPR